MTPLQAFEAPHEMLAINQWKLEIGGVQHATFSAVSGFQRNVGTIERHDGGTGLRYTFPNQIKTYGPLSFTRQVEIDDNGDIVDGTLSDYVTEAMENGTKVDAVLVKYHQGRSVFKIVVYGLLFHTEQLPNFDKNAGSVFEITYPASCDFYEWTQEKGPQF